MIGKSTQTKELLESQLKITKKQLEILKSYFIYKKYLNLPTELVTKSICKSLYLENSFNIYLVALAAPPPKGGNS